MNCFNVPAWLLGGEPDAEDFFRLTMLSRAVLRTKRPELRQHNHVRPYRQH